MVQKKIIKALLLFTVYQNSIYGSLCSSRVLSVIGHNETPPYVLSHLKTSNGIYSDKLPHYTRLFSHEKVESIKRIEELLSTFNGKDGDELNILIPPLTKSQTPENIEDLLHQTYLEALHKLGVKNPQDLSTKVLYEENRSYMIDKKNIAPYFATFTEPMPDLFRKLLQMFPEDEKIPNITTIAPWNTHPINMPACTVPNNEQKAFEIYVSNNLVPYEKLFIFAHELNHVLNMDPHRLQKAHMKAFNGSMIQKAFRYQELDSLMATLSRALEFNADTGIIFKIMEKNPNLARELCAHGINCITNKIALENILEKLKNGDPESDKETLTSHGKNDQHPTWLARLLVLLRIYEGLHS